MASLRVVVILALLAIGLFAGCQSSSIGARYVSPRWSDIPCCYYTINLDFQESLGQPYKPPRDTPTSEWDEGWLVHFRNRRETEESIPRPVHEFTVITFLFNPLEQSEEQLFPVWEAYEKLTFSDTAASSIFSEDMQGAHALEWPWGWPNNEYNGTIWGGWRDERGCYGGKLKASFAVMLVDGCGFTGTNELALIMNYLGRATWVRVNQFLNQSSRNGN